MPKELTAGAASASVFHCTTCGQEAGRVQLYLAGKPIGSDGGHEARKRVALLDRVTRLIRPADQATLVVETFYGVEQMPVFSERLEKVRDAITASDAAALYRLSYSYAPFHCPDCFGEYCGEHWDWKRFKRFEDDSYVGGVEGRCPNGHFHVMSD